MHTNESAFTTERKQGFGKFILFLVVLFGICWLLYRGATSPKPVLPEFPQAAPTAESWGTETHRVYFNGSWVEVKPCTMITSDCADQTPGKPVDYGTGFTIRDGGRRADPPAGWEYADCPAGQRVYAETIGDVTTLSCQ